MVNEREKVEKLLDNAREDGLEVTFSEEERMASYFDEENGYGRCYYFDETAETLEARITMDKKVEEVLDKSALASFLLEKVDPNALMAMEKLLIVWDDEEGHSDARDEVEELYGDEYAQFVAEDLLGTTWTDRQIVVVNFSEIIASCNEIYQEEYDNGFDEFAAEAILQTIFHEFRHLFYECNELVEIGEGTPYSQMGGVEDAVEDYGNALAREHLEEFTERVVNEKNLASLEEKEDEKDLEEK